MTVPPIRLSVMTAQHNGYSNCRFLRFGRNDGTAHKVICHDSTAQHNGYSNYRFLRYACSAGASYASVGMTAGGFVIVSHALYAARIFSATFSGVINEVSMIRLN